MTAPEIVCLTAVALIAALLWYSGRGPTNPAV